MTQATEQARFHVDHAVFWPATGTLSLLVLVATVWPERSGTFFQNLLQGIVHYASWYYLLVVAVILVAVGFFSLSRAGDIRLGPDHSAPDYSYLSWFAMLFAAGMGIGLMFFGVAEPVMHFLSPPLGDGGTTAAAAEAMKLTFFHWGLHAWAIYAIVALMLAYFAFRHGLPLTLRSAFYPLVGERIHGPFGAAIDVFAIVSTTCGVATSLGLGVLQINGGLNYLFGLEISVGVQIALIIGTMLLATVSVVLGLDAGIKRLSELNIGLSIILLGSVLLAGPTVVILQGTVENFGTYIGDLVTNTFNLYAYDPTDWLGGWTIFYWGWWLSWSPFVGLFIARISRGRTIREFVLGAMLVPCGFTLMWMGVFGNSAIELILHGGASGLAEAVRADQSVALFSFLEFLPLTALLSGISLLMIVVFFVTSADSGAMVLNMLCANGRDDTPAPQRIFWTALIALIAIALLLAGGLSALQTAAIASALPFSLALLGAIWGFASALRTDVTKRGTQTVTPFANQPGDWRRQLSTLLHYPDEAAVKRFMQTTVASALQDFAGELATHQVAARVVDEIPEKGSIRLEAAQGDEVDFVYRVRCRPRPMPSAGAAAESDAYSDDGDIFYRAEVHLAEGGQDYCVMGWAREQINHDILSQYQTHLQFLHSQR